MASTPNWQTKSPAAGAPMSPGYIKRLDVNPSSISFSSSSLFDNVLYNPLCSKVGAYKKTLYIYT